MGERLGVPSRTSERRPHGTLPGFTCPFPFRSPDRLTCFHYHHHGCLYPPNLVLESPDNEPWVINENIFHILNTYLQPNATLSPANAAQEIDKLLPTQTSQEKKILERMKSRKVFFWEMWGVVISVAQPQIPWKHPGRIGLVKLIQTLKDFS